jgi:hypothetical protein
MVANTFSENPALALAIEGMASAATEVLGNTFCNYLESLVGKEDLMINLPINPGMVGWPVEEGQPKSSISWIQKSLESHLNPAD